MNLVIRADANGSVGTGHLMRCLALGQVWRDHGGQVATGKDRLLAHLDVDVDLWASETG